MTNGSKNSGTSPPSRARGRHGVSSGAGRHGAFQRDKELTPAEKQALAAALARTPDDLLDELRNAWDMPVGRPIRVVGRLKLTSGDIVFLNHFEHPETGVGLFYPSLRATSSGSEKLTFAFVPVGPSREVASPRAMATGDQWAIAEVELSSSSERLKHQNPWRVDVRSGTLRLLSELPAEWQVQVHGAQSIKRISTLAREAIERGVRDSVLKEDQDLARRHADNVRRLDELATNRRSAEDEASRLLAELGQQMETLRLRGDQARQDADDLQQRLASERYLLERRQRHIEEETLLMQLRHRQLKELLSEKRGRLIALGLVDADDIDAVLSEDGGGGDDRPGIGFPELLDSDFARLAPALQVEMHKKGLLYPQALVRDFLALLRTRDLVVLAGDSGSGKTSLVRAAADAIGGECIVIPVKPNWTGPEDLLGYYNPVERSYQATQFLVALQAAARRPDVPYFICLDEMNLARVEHYFADFLSLLEQRATLPTIELYTADEERHVVVEQGLFLHVEAEARRRGGLPDDATLEDILGNEQANEEIHRILGLAGKKSLLLHHGRLRRSLAAQMRTPTSLTLPANVWIFGAVNMDETTHPLSPKVLDRVHLLRFPNPMLANWDAIEDEINVARESLPGDMPALRLHAHEIGMRMDYPPFDRGDEDVQFLSRISSLFLDPLGVEFGLRAIRQSQGYIAAAKMAGFDADQALDNVIRHKILPKIAFDTARPTGSGRPRREVLLELRAELARRLEDANLDPKTGSVAELDRMIRLAEGNNGIISYWLR